MDQLHKHTNNIQPAVNEGASCEITSVITPSFTLGHALKFATLQSNSYTFMSIFQLNKTLFHASMDHDANLSARIHHSWKDLFNTKQTTKIEAQFAQQSIISIEHELSTQTKLPTLLHCRLINPNPFNSSNTPTGIFSATVLQHLTPSFQIGAEFSLQKPTPHQSDSSLTYSVVYTPTPCLLPPALDLPPSVPSPFPPVNPKDPTQIYTSTFTPATGLLHLSYYRRLNQRHECSLSLQTLTTSQQKGARREGIVIATHKLQTLFANIKSCIDSTGKVASVVEWHLAPGLSFNVGAEVEYAKGGGGVGKVGVGFNMEA